MSDLPTILFTCEACGIQGRVPENFRGKTARCPSCKHVQIIPMDAPSPPSSGATQRIAQPTITRSFANPSNGDVSDDTRGRALLGIIERLEKIEGLHDRLQASMQRLQSRSNAGDEDVDGRITQLQNNLTQTQHAVTALHHMETRMEAIGKKVEVIQRSLNRQEHDRQIEEVFAQLKRLQRQLDHGGHGGDGSSNAEDDGQAVAQLTAISEQWGQQLAILEERIAVLETTPNNQTNGGPAHSAGDHQFADDIAGLSATVSALRNEQDEQLDALRQRIEGIEGQGPTDIGTGDGTGAEVIREIQDEVAELREALAALPEPTSSSETREVIVRRGSPALAILALLVAIAAAAGAGFLFTERQQIHGDLSALNERLTNQNASIEALSSSLAEQREATAQLSSDNQRLSTELASGRQSLDLAIAGISDDVENVSARLGPISERLDGSDTAVGELRSQVSDLSTTLSSLREAVSALQTPPEVDDEGVRASIETLRGQLTALSVKVDATANQLKSLSIP